MGLICKVIRNDYEIGEISDVTRDMWYIEGKWPPFHTYLTGVKPSTISSYD